MIACNDFSEPVDDDTLLPSEDELSELADDMGWSPDREPAPEDDL